MGKYRNADSRGIEGASMTGFEMARIRENAGLSVYELAAVLRYRDVDGLRKLERNGGFVSGPIQLCMEAIRDGRIDPGKELQ